MNAEKVIWAVDAFAERDFLSPGVVDLLKAMSDAGAKIEPVYVLGPEELGLDAELGLPWTTLYQPIAERALAVRLQAAGMAKACLPLKVILQNKPALRESVDSVVRYAEATGASAILASSAGRTGLERAVLGSFAETLLLSSRVPVVIAGRAAAGSGGPGIEEVLFPTDFGDRTDEALAEAIGLARRFRARLTILHAIRRPIGPLIERGAYLFTGAWVPLPELRQHREDESRRRGEPLVARAIEQGVQAELVIAGDASGVADAIVGQARASSARGRIIFMAARSGPLRSALVGSVTRQVARQAPCPVWVAPLRENSSDARADLSHADLPARPASA